MFDSRGQMLCSLISLFMARGGETEMLVLNCDIYVALIPRTLLQIQAVF